MKSFSLPFLLFLTVISVGLSAQAQKATPCPSAHQQTAIPLKVSKAARGRVRITNGKFQAVVDLEKDISGCFDLYDPTDRKFRVKDSAGITVIDIVSKDAKHYIVLLADAESNCNVQGHCGAARDYTLIWLKLDDHLKLEDKRAAVIEDCRSSIFVIEPDYPREPDKDLELKLVDGKLNLKYGDISKDSADSSRLIYDRNAPEKSFLITTEKAKSLRH
jgi:hypothetical protein